MVKNVSTVQETWVQSLSKEDPLEKGMATHSSILAWEMPRTEELAGYSPWGHKESDTTEQPRVFSWFFVKQSLGHASLEKCPVYQKLSQSKWSWGSLWEERGFKGREVGEISVQLANYVDSITVNWVLVVQASCWQRQLYLKKFTLQITFGAPKFWDLIPKLSRYLFLLEIVFVSCIITRMMQLRKSKENISKSET